MGELASGHLAVRALRQTGVRHLFTLSGGHIFPLYDGCRHEGVRLVDTRHEQAAVFAAEGLARLSRRPQAAAVTAGPGVTNSLSAVATAAANGSPLLLIGGRAPAGTWGAGGLQEIDHVAFVGPLVKRATTSLHADRVAADVLSGLHVAATPHRGPAFVDVPMDVIYAPADETTVPAWDEPRAAAPDDEQVARAGRLLARADRPVLIAGTGAWLNRAEHALRGLAETVGAPVLQNGMGRGLLPADHALVISWARRTALQEADVVVVVGTPLDFRLGYGRFGTAQVVHVTDDPAQLAAAPHPTTPAVGVAGDLVAALEGIARSAGGTTDEKRVWQQRLRDVEQAARAEQAALLEADGDRIHPVRVYGELRRVLDRDAVVIGDGGDFVSFAGRYIDSYTPGTFLDPGPYGCLGTGMGYGIAARLAHPDRQVCVLLGDGAAGFGLMDADTLVRHDLPVVMVLANNGMWALEKYPMQALYDGWDAAADLRQETRYDEVVTALGGAGETVDKPADVGPALERAFASGVPYLLNVRTDPTVAYPRSTVLA